MCLLIDSHVPGDFMMYLLFHYGLINRPTYPFIMLNPLNPNSDKIEISLYIITTCSNIQVMRVKKQSPRIRCLDIKILLTSSI